METFNLIIVRIPFTRDIDLSLGYLNIFDLMNSRGNQVEFSWEITKRRRKFHKIKKKYPIIQQKISQITREKIFLEEW